MSNQANAAAAQHTQPREFALVTQMRAGTHFLCYALRMGLDSTIYRPNRERRYILMEDEYITRGLHKDEITLPEASPDNIIYFNHYYHPQLQTLPGVRRINLIGFPFDSFYSDGVVYSKASYDVGPSGPRAGGYVMRADSHEWKFLEEKMVENADWLDKLDEDQDNLVLRYEDFFLDFDRSVERLSRFVGGLVRPVPKPIKNANRMYWTDAYSSSFDAAGLKKLFRLFGPATRRFYPEKWDKLQAAASEAAKA